MLPRLLLCLSLATFALGLPKSCQPGTFDACVNRMLMFGDANFTFPMTMVAMNRRCRDAKHLAVCTKDYTRDCLTGDARNTVSLILYGVAKSNRGYCTTAKRKASHVAFGKCANAHKKEILKTVDAANRVFHGIKVYPEARLRIPMLCCAYFGWKASAMGIIRKDCTQREADGYEHLIDSYAADGLNLLCGDYTDTSDKCASLEKKIPEWKKPFENKVYFLTVVDVLKSL